MNDSFSRSTFGGTSAGGQGLPTGIFEAMDQLRGMFEQRGATQTRMGRGDVRSAILGLLAEQPMHGYQLIHEIEERSGGAWKPSPGSVYPTLQMLADEGLIVAEEASGKKTYSLTETGRAEAGEAGERSAPWEAPAARSAAQVSALPKAGAKLAQAVGQVVHSGTAEQAQQAVDVLDEARRRIFTILAQD